MKVRVILLVGIAALAVMPALAAPLVPKLKAGMWNETDKSNFVLPGAQNVAGNLNSALAKLSAVSNVNRFCVDDAVQEKISMVGGPMPPMRCTRDGYSKAKDGVSLKFTCKTAQGPMALRIEAHGDMSSSFTASVTLDSGPSGRTEQIKQFHYLGACTDGLRPGEILIQGMPKTRMDLTYPPAIK